MSEHPRITTSSVQVAEESFTEVFHDDVLVKRERVIGDVRETEYFSPSGNVIKREVVVVYYYDEDGNETGRFPHRSKDL